MEKTVSGSKLHDVVGLPLQPGAGRTRPAGYDRHHLPRLGAQWLFSGLAGPPVVASSRLRDRWSWSGLLTTVLAARSQVSRQRFERGGTRSPFYFFVALGTFFAGRVLIYGTL